MAVAERAGVSKSTASRVLRGMTGIKPDKAERVRAAARALGYAPNPLMQALLTGVRRQRPERRGNLAWLMPYDPAYFLRKGWNPRGLIEEGARRRAEELGFGLDRLRVDGRGLSAERLESMLRARQVGGVVLAPADKPKEPLAFPWAEFPVSQIGRPFHPPFSHHVILHYYHAMQLVLEKLEARGYRRIGFATAQLTDERMEHVPLTVFNARRARLPASRWLEPQVFEGWTVAQMDEWLGRTKPDAVVAGLPEIYQLILRTGRRVPEDLGVATLSWRAATAECAGVRHPFRAMGAAAVDLVVAQIHRNERGVPEHAKAVMLEGEWVEGRTLSGR
jgi:LacI family transcriptional regulator